MKRLINKNLIREWIKINGKGSLEKLAFESGCSASLIQKLCAESYERVPSISKIDGISKVTGYDLDELFPLDRQEEKKKLA